MTNSQVNYFRLYLLNKNTTTGNVLLNIKQYLWDEFYKPNNLNFKDLGNWFQIFTFSWTKKYDNKKPEWFSFLNIIWEDKIRDEMDNDFISVKSSILSILSYKWDYYAISYWNAFHTLIWLVDEEFWIEFAKKLITKDGKIKSINQSVIKWDLESTYKSMKNNSNYIAMYDRSNLWKKLKGVKWTWYSGVFTNKIFKKINLWLEGNKWIKISLWNIDWLDLNLFIGILKEIIDIYNNKSIIPYRIPDLKKITNDSEIIDIRNCLINSISSLTKNNTSSLRENMYFSTFLFINFILDGKPWYIESFELVNWTKSVFFDVKNNWDFEDLDFFKFLEDNNVNFSNISDFHFTKIKYYSIESGSSLNTRKKPRVLNFIQWEIEFKKQLYLFEWSNFYKPNYDFKELVKEEFSNKLSKILLPNTFMNKWIRWAEKDYNLEQSKVKGFYCFDKWVSPKYWLDWIELCDLLKYDWKDLYFIHVKKSHWADLRILFSQWRVWTDKIIEDYAKSYSHFLHNWDNGLKNIDTLIKTNNFNLVYAIKDSEWRTIQQSFTLYAQYDFIATLEYFYSKWIDNVKIFNL